MKNNILKPRGKSVCIPFRDIIEANKATGIENLSLQEMFDVAGKKDKHSTNILIPAASTFLIIACLVVLATSPGKAVFAYQQASRFDLLLEPSIPAMGMSSVYDLYNWSLGLLTLTGTAVLGKLTFWKSCKLI